jgi:hypothetical protein
MKGYLAMALLLFSYAGGTDHPSKTSPGYSLAPLAAEQCGYAAAVINQVTRNIAAAENGTLTEQNSKFPAPVENLDSYVRSKVETLTFAPVQFAGALLADLGKPASHTAKSAKLKISLDQREFAYVLELRGCPLEASSVNFVK